MGWIDNLRSKYAYNEWANNKVLGAAAGLSDEEMLAARPGSYESLANDFSHLVRTQYAWYSVLTETQFSPPPEIPEIGVMQALNDWFNESHAMFRELAKTFSEDWLVAEVHPSRGGKQYTLTRWWVTEHLATHGVAHRAEIGKVLLTLDRSPGDLDFIDFVTGNVK